MSAHQLRTELHQLIDDTSDEALLRKTVLLLTRTRKHPAPDWWDTLTPEVQVKIDAALEAVERGETIPHSEAVRQVKASYAHILGTKLE